MGLEFLIVSYETLKRHSEKENTLKILVLEMTNIVHIILKDSRKNTVCIIRKVCFCTAELVYGSFGQSNIHRTLNSCSDQPGMNRMHPS